MFDDTRGETFKRLFEQEMEDIRDRLRPHGIWTGGATRKRARAFARLKARDRMRAYREQKTAVQ